MLKLDSKKQNIWFTSDTHYWHKNIVAGETSWSNPEDSCRNFKTTQEMSRHLVEQLNSYVGQDDILFHLGDWSFGGIENIWNFRKQLIVKEIHLIYGNHDTHIANDKILPNCNTNVFGKVVDKKEGMLGRNTLAQELFTSTEYYSEIMIDKHMLCLMHYPIASWNRYFLHLHGHTHGTFEVIPNRLDVGIDNYFKLHKEYKPFSFEEVIKFKEASKFSDRY